MRILFIGAVRFSASMLRTLIALEAEVVGVCTLRESAANSDHVDLTPLCREAGIPVRYAPSINDEDVVRWVGERAPEVIFCFGWSRLLGPAMLRAAPLGVVGYHPAALPAHRGRHPLIWALALGLEESASTFFFMDEGADSGDILSQRPLPILASDDAASLYQRMIDVADDQLRAFLPALADGSYERTAQDHTRAGCWRGRGKRDGCIDWRMSARSIHNLVRALAEPYVGAHFMWGGCEVKVWRTEIVAEPALDIEPGKVLRSDANGVVVKAGSDAVRLLCTVPPMQVSEGDYL